MPPGPQLVYDASSQPNYPGAKPEEIATLTLPGLPPLTLSYRPLQRPHDGGKACTCAPFEIKGLRAMIISRCAVFRLSGRRGLRPCCARAAAKRDELEALQLR